MTISNKFMVTTTTTLNAATTTPLTSLSYDHTITSHHYQATNAEPSLSLHTTPHHLITIPQATHEWFKIYKMPTGKPANEFAFSGEAKDKVVGVVAVVEVIVVAMVVEVVVEVVVVGMVVEVVVEVVVVGMVVEVLWWWSITPTATATYYLFISQFI